MDAAAAREGRRIRVRGLVQGVGFRPFVWRLAQELSLAGEVSNDGEGVLIAAWGPSAALDQLAQRLAEDAPLLARVSAVEMAALGGAPAGMDFRIVASGEGTAAAVIPPDAATCPACLAEVHDPAERRHGYAFANCTHCGPRLTIAAAIPWDRPNTAMKAFPLCPACRAEYDDPADRRFHAQPIACPDCGPRLWFIDKVGEAAGDSLQRTVAALRAGRIAAIKGLGGFHLACDARNGEAVALLRQRKARDAKPFALMCADPAAICVVSPAAAALLASPAAPIVLLPRRADVSLPEALAPDQDHLGVMLPATPLHHLLLVAFGGPLVMTSGNRSEEPQIIDNDSALAELGGIADVFLLHDRPILNRLDDSVIALDAAQQPIPLRRARGYAPAPIALPIRDCPPTLAMGGELKATFALLRGGEAIVSQHIGDLEQAGALEDYRRMLDLYCRLYQFSPAVIAVDRHAGYLSTQLGEALALETGARLVRVAHHHAHFAACLADNGIPDSDEEHLGLLLDGLGLGDDDTLWGGEILAGNYRSARRVGGFPAVPLIGGGAAMREPWRNLLAHLAHAFGPDWRTRAAPVLQYMPDAGRLDLAERMLASGTNCPPCSSAGRLFDAAAAALGLHPARISHEGQAAMALEALARPYAASEEPYRAGLDAGGTLDWAPLWDALLADLAAGREPGWVAARFHLGVATAVADAAARLARPGQYVALSGGVMQNRILLAAMREALNCRGLVPLGHRTVPANDGGLSLGQGLIAGFA